MSPSRMERFTRHARLALAQAQNQAAEMQHELIDTEHILLALMEDRHSVAGRALAAVGLEQQRVAEAVRQRMPPASGQPAPLSQDLSARVKRLLELAVDEARRLNHHYIGTEHLLLGLTRLSEGVAIDVLRQFGVSPEEVRTHVHQALQEAAPDKEAALKPRELATLEVGGPVTVMAFSPSGGLLAAATGDTVTLWQLPAGQAVATLAGRGGAVRALAFSPYGDILAVALDDGSVRVWRLL
mgnify:CR=1 FL=1